MMLRRYVTEYIGDVELSLSVVVYPGEPAKLYGPPENCYEGSPDEIEIVAVIGPDGTDFTLTSDQHDYLIDRLYGRIEEFFE